MKRDKITNLIDSKIKESLSKNNSINTVQFELAQKIQNFTNTLQKDNIDINILLKLKFDELYPLRTRYGVTYIQHSLKRIEDLNWLITNQSKFPRASYCQIFNLLRFKDKLLNDKTEMPF
jgi:hypothetical protein